MTQSSVLMTFEQLNEYIQRSCRDFHGIIDQPSVILFVERYGKHLTSDEQILLLCQMVYDRKYDSRLKYGRVEE